MKKPEPVFMAGNVLISNLERGMYSRGFYDQKQMDAFLEEQAEKVKELILLLDEYPSVEQQAKEEQLAKEILFALRGKAKEKEARGAKPLKTQ